MSFWNQALGIILSFLVIFCTVRLFLDGIKTYQLNNSAYKKRKKGQTLKEWFCHTRFKKEIPKILMSLYWFIISLHGVALIVCFILWLAEIDETISEWIPRGVWYVDGIVAFIILIFSRESKKRGAHALYEKFIKKQGQKPKKRL